MKKKLIIIIGGIVVVAAVVVGYLALKNSDSDHAITQKDPASGQNIYTNLDYGFSIAYGDDWEGPAQTKDDSTKASDPLYINAVFRSNVNSEAIVIVGKPGDKESFNDFARLIDSSTVVTVAGLSALRYEYVSAINEEGTLYAKIVMFVFKGLPQGSITMAYQKIFDTEKEAKAANLSRLDDFLTHITFK